MILFDIKNKFEIDQLNKNTKPMSDIIKTLTTSVQDLEKNFEALNLNDFTSVKAFESHVLELLANLKRNQDKPEYEHLEDDFEDLIYRVIIILGQLDLQEV